MIVRRHRLLLIRSAIAVREGDKHFIRCPESHYGKLIT